MNANTCSICGIEIANGELISGDDEDVAAAMGSLLFSQASHVLLTTSHAGYVCHIVVMAAKYLEIPLRFPIKLLGSRSTIRVRRLREHPSGVKCLQDDLSPALQDRERECVCFA